MPWNVYAARSLLSALLQLCFAVVYIYNGTRAREDTVQRLINTWLPIPDAPQHAPDDPNVQAEDALVRQPNRVVGLFTNGDPIRQYDDEAPPHEPYYAVRIGRNPGIYRSWITAGQQTDRYPGAIHQRFANQASAVQFMQE
jgi:Caulimovirus viroplasmin